MRFGATACPLPDTQLSEIGQADGKAEAFPTVNGHWHDLCLGLFS
jgi:hypothetical protein